MRSSLISMVCLVVGLAVGYFISSRLSERELASAMIKEVAMSSRTILASLENDEPEPAREILVGYLSLNRTTLALYEQDYCPIESCPEVAMILEIQRYQDERASP